MSTSALADYHIFGVLSDGDLNAGAQLKCDSINTKDVHNVVFAVNIQAVASSKDKLLKIESCKKSFVAMREALTLRKFEPNQMQMFKKTFETNIKVCGNEIMK